MKKRLIAPTAIALAIAAGVGGGALPATTAAASGGTLTVWLMTGDSVPAVYNAVNKAFESEYPGWTVNIEIQQWGGIGAKIISALAGSTPPDVMELGNTDVSYFAASGGLTNLAPDKSQFQNSANWLSGLEGPAEYNGGLYAIPELAGDRAVMYNKAMFKAAGIESPPTTLSELLGDGAVLKNLYKNRAGFSAFYLPGEEWYADVSFVWAEGGQIAIKQGGKWVGDLDAKQSLDGLQEYQAFQNFMSTPASQDVTEANPSDAQIFASGKSAMFYDGSWNLSTIVADNKAMAGNIGVFVMPGVTAATPAPVFLGGSDLGIAKNSPNQAQALAWVKLYAGSTNQLASAAAQGWIPNATNLIPQVKLTPTVATFFKAATVSQFTPATPGWETVEADNVMQDLFAQVAEGQEPVSTIAQVYDLKLDNLLNQSS